ncbi:MAG: hypothetical protein KF779_14390 [Hyphomonadaceae bacterium]|nr:hypothetical protein [Hyphomonadaceae bacterium]
MTRKEEAMNRERFAELLAAYGADFRRWPAETRADAATFAAQDAEASALIAEARELDSLLDEARSMPTPSADLAERILASAPRMQRPSFDRRAVLALAACAVFGVVIGYSGGLLAPPAVAEDDGYFSMAFEAPTAFEDEG